MVQPITCSACGSADLDGLAVVLAGSDRFTAGIPLRVLVYCHRRCLRHPELAAPTAHHVALKLATEELLLGWYRSGKTTSAPDIVSDLVWGEPRPTFITKATKILEARAAKEPTW